MGAEVSKVSRICGKKKGPKAPNSADPTPDDQVNDEFEDFDDGGLIEKNRDNYFHKEDIEKIAKKFENYKEWMDQSLSSSRKPSIRQKKMKWKEGEIIGNGSFGRVILGLNLQTGSIMAVKQVQVGNANTNAQQERIKALEIEIDLLSQLTHKNIVRYYGSHQSKTTFNIFLEYISGGTIASLIEKYGPLNENLARVYTRQILEGLEYLHVRNTIHRDIKGANVLVDNSGVCKLADFGTAKRISSIVESELRYMPSIRGTVNWMAPEVIKQTSLGRQSDIWSVGCTLLEMVTGKIPWAHLMKPGATQISALYQIASAKTHPPLPEGLSPEAIDFLKQCFKVNPQDRPNVVKLLSHRFIAGEQVERPLDTPDRQRSVTSRGQLVPSSARHKKADSISSKLGDKLEGSKHISAFSRQRFDTHRDHLGGTEESEPIMISSPGGREKMSERKQQMSARDPRREVDRLRSSKYTFNTEEQEKIKSPSLAPVKSNQGLLPSLPDDNPSNVYLVSRPDSFLEDNLLKRERIMSDPEYVNLMTENQNNESHHVGMTQTARDTVTNFMTDPTSPPGRLRTKDFEQKKMDPLALNKKFRTRPLGKNEMAKRGSLGGKDDESSNILLSLGDIVKKQTEQGAQDTSGLHLRSKSNFGLTMTSRALQPSNNAIEEPKSEIKDTSVIEEKKLEAHKRLGTLGLETPRYLETEPRQPTKGGSRVLEARESEPTPRLVFQNKALMSSKTAGYSNATLEMNTQRTAAATHRGVVTHRELQDYDRVALARLRFGKHPPEKKISIKVKEVLKDDTELNMESYSRDNTGAEPNFSGLPVPGSVILDKMEKDGQKDGHEAHQVKAV